ncbi:hypothetical protein CspHIS471_0611230 [Cutaneotrichosporon sp. HIS471]|nr:hypothetical protein CspHIS471_0611230 [Cutaneotrichosporon sp. HIS471]
MSVHVLEHDKPLSTIEHVETQENKEVDVADGSGLMKSPIDHLSIWQTLWIFKRVVIFIILVYTGYVCEGFELNAGGTIVANKGFLKQFGARDQEGVRALDPTWLSTWGAMLNVGQIVTFTHISWVADRWGRKTAFYLAWLWLMAGCMIMNFATTSGVWAIAKLCNGAGIGVLQVVCQVYVMEICPDKIRGGMVIFQAVWTAIGGIICSIMMQQLNKHYPEDFRLPLRILWAPIGLMLICWSIVPESPWYHARRGNEEAARNAMRRLYGNIPWYNYDEEYGIILRTLEHEKASLAENKPRFRDVFKGVNLRRTLTVMIVAVCQQFAGLAIISTYNTYFFSLVGMEDPFLATLILSCVALLAVTLWALSADRLGRRMIVNICETCVVVICFVVGALYYTGASMGNKAAGTALLVICCIWQFTYQAVGMCYYLYSAELPSAILRIKTGPITFFTNSITGIATVYATPPMLLALNLRAAFVYGALSVPMCVLMWLYLPETKGRSAAEIDELFENKVPAWKWNKTVTTVEEELAAVQRARGARPEDA